MADFDTDLRTAADHFNGGRMEDAVRLCGTCLAARPDHPDALHLYGVILFRLGKLREAIVPLEKAVRVHPQGADYWYNLGRVLEGLNHVGESAEAYGQAARLSPDAARGWFRYGRALALSGRPEEAIPQLRRALDIDPDMADALYSLGNACLGLGRNEEAAAAFERCLEASGAHYGAAANAGVAYLQQGRMDKAIELLRRAIELEPETVHAYLNLGTALAHAGETEAAVRAYQKASSLKPDDAGILSNLATALGEQARHEEAKLAIEKAIKLDSSPRGPWHNLLMDGFYRADHEPEQSFRQHKAWGEGVEGALPAAVRRHDLDRDPDRPLRVGLVSPDFCQHPVARFLLPILAGADRESVDYIAFAQQGWSDEMTDALKVEVSEWHEIQLLGDEAAAALVRDRKVDILVDLAGHTANTRLGVFMRRPAPVQATYLGYPGTTGLTSIQYRLTDAWADPPEKTDRYHTEELVRIPRGFLCFEPPADAPEVVEPPVLRNGHVTFGSFNNMAKLSGRSIALWARVLEAVPGSRLFLKSRPLGDPLTRSRIEKRFAAAGVAADRLILRGRVDGYAGHLAAYGEVDIALDTVPYNGTTTSCEALYMGVPMVGLAGLSHVTRVGVSILSACGLAKLIGRTEDDYVAIAAALAENNERLVQLREAIRPAMLEAPLTDRAGFCRRIEGVWRELWRRHVTEETDR